MNNSNTQTQAFEDIPENSIEIICPDCSSIVSYELDDFDGDSIFCPECGSTIKLDDRIEIICDNCNHSINVFPKYFSDGKVFCPECGIEIEICDNTNVIACIFCGNDVSYNPEEVVDNSVKCEKCGKTLLLGTSAEADMDETSTFEEYDEDAVSEEYSDLPFKEYDEDEYTEEYSEEAFEAYDEAENSEDYDTHNKSVPVTISLSKEHNTAVDVTASPSNGSAFEEAADEDDLKSTEAVSRNHKRPVAWFDSFYEDEEEVLDFTSNFAEELPEWDITPPSIPVRRISAGKH